MANGSLISFDDLQAWTGYNRKADVINWLKSHGVIFHVARNGEPVTTEKAINTALLGEPNHEQWNFESVPART